MTSGGLLIGVTGPSGAGKSTVLACWASLGAAVVDADAVYHGLLASDEGLRAAILNRFPQACDGTGGVDRKALARIVFADPGALAELERITHPAVISRVERILSDLPRPAALEAVALFESGLDALCSVTVAVTAPEEVRLRRLMSRDNRTEAELRARMAAGKPGQWYCDRADYTLDGGGPADAEAVRLFRRLCKE